MLLQRHKSTVYPVELRVLQESESGALKFSMVTEQLNLMQLKKVARRFAGGFAVKHPFSPELGFLLFNHPMINNNAWDKNNCTHLEFTEFQLVARIPWRYKLLRNLLPVSPQHQPRVS